MLAASLFSGGKESVHAISTVRHQGVEVTHSIHEIPSFSSPHIHNVEASKLLAKSMNKHFAVVDLYKGEQELVYFLKSLNVDALVAGDIDVRQHVVWLQNICSQAGISLVKPLFEKSTLVVSDMPFFTARTA